MFCLRVLSTAIVMLLSACGALEWTEEDEAKKRAFYNRHLPKYAPEHLQYAKSKDIAVIKGEYGRFTFTQTKSYFVKGPMIVEGQGIRYTNGAWPGGSLEHVVHLDPGDYRITTWVKVVSSFECETIGGEWEACEKPKPIRKDTRTSRLPTGEVIERTTVEKFKSRMVFERLKLVCDIHLEPMVEVRHGEITLDCLREYTPTDDMYENLDFHGVSRLDGARFISAEHVTEDDLDQAESMTTGIVTLQSSQDEGDR